MTDEERVEKFKEAVSNAMSKYFEQIKVTIKEPIRIVYKMGRIYNGEITVNLDVEPRTSECNCEHLTPTNILG